MKRLCTETLSLLPGDVRQPGYEAEQHQAGIVHIGTGAFHRAHQAVYTDTALAESGGHWRIVGASLRSKTMHDQLRDQDGLYTVTSRENETQEVRVIAAIERVIFAPDRPQELIDQIADPMTRVVTMTITEKGYCFDPATQSLDGSNKLVAKDLRNIDSPKSAPGYLVAGLLARREKASGPLSILSCDNLPDNGTVTQTVVMQLASSIDPALATWIDGNVTFPSSMVDRIVPATTNAELAFAANKLGVVDQCPVLTETFSQWVIEDQFAAGRPAWEAAGANFVSDVKPFENMKLRLLNGSHSAMAYLGNVAGIQYIHEVISRPLFARYIQAMMDDEITPTLDVPGFDLVDYKRQLSRRFANSAVPYETRQVAMDGSMKLPQRLLETIRERQQTGASIDYLALAVAGWMRFVSGQDEAGNRIELNDPIADQLAGIRDNYRREPAAMVNALLTIRSVFPEELSCNRNFRETVTQSLASLYEHGVEETISRALV